MSKETEKCAEVLDHLSEIVDGDQEVLARYAEHLAECDGCRDARHDAALAAELAAHAGADFEPVADLEKKVLAALDARGESAQVRPTAPVQTPEVKASVAAAPSSMGVAPTMAAPTPVKARPPAQPDRSRRRTVNLIMAAAAVLLVVAGGVGILVPKLLALRDRVQTPQQPQVATPTPTKAGTWATVAQIVRAASDGATGVSIRQPGAAGFVPATVDTQLGPGAAVRTDDRTRVKLVLSDQSVLVLNHNTELSLDAQTPRLLHLSSGGEVLADVAHLEGGPQAVIQTPTGRVEVVGTKLLVSATDESASVRVTRGEVRVVGNDGSQDSAKPGEEALLPRSGRVRVSSAVDLAGSLAWSELGGGEVERSVSGLGELKARVPSDRSGSERPLSLVNHKVRVRIVGNIARTEVEESFRNDTRDTLEGIYSFPLPPDARIASLALDVDGQMVNGAFVERDTAAKIWQGVITKVGKAPQPLQREEFIWVPGPWRDPALLEWQHGGQFQLRIFPIKAQSERRVILAYEQTVQPFGQGRRYVYPLPHSADASTKVGLFDLDLRVAGADPATPVTLHGYQAQVSDDGGAKRVAMSQVNFLPAGDVVVDYRMAGGDQEMRWWTYQGPAAAAPSVAAARPGSERGSPPEIVAAQQALADDQRPYVAFAIRPELPMRTASRPRDYVLVVDSSQSMVGERFTRAAQLVAGVIGEMDRRDRFTVMACDATCRSKPGGPLVPSAEAAAEAQQWLGEVRPAGASDLVQTLGEAAALARGTGAGRDVRVIYIGDGMASVGHRRASAIADTVRNLVQPSAGSGSLTFTAVGIGGDSDTLVLSAIARSGGGHYVPYVPGQRVNAAALRILETTYGVALQEARLEFPAGVSDVAPTQLPTLRAGEEVIVSGRFTGEVRGEVVLRGTVAGQPYEDRYPVQLTASTAAGNAFVPRLWAAATIDELQLRGQPDEQARVVGLSRGYGVMSRHTSLLVLESEAMFRAFGIDQARSAVSWTGEEEMDGNVSTGTEQQQAATVFDDLFEAGEGGGGGGGAPAPERARRSSATGLRRDEGVQTVSAEAEPAAPVATPRPMTKAAPSGSAGMGRLGAFGDDAPVAANMRGPGRWMRQVWERVGSITVGAPERERDRQTLLQAEQALRESPDSRDRTRSVFQALARLAQTDRAEQLAEQWLGRDRIDPEALIALSDTLGRQGRRDEALRLLTGVVDLEPDNQALQQRLAEAFERSGNAVRACSHRVAAAEGEGAGAEAIAAAIRCEQGLGDAASAAQLLAGVTDPSLRRQVDRAVAAAPRTATASGDFSVEASWAGAQDLDLSIIGPQGQRISWMGGRTNIVGDGASAPGRERLGLRFTPVGTYDIEISRTDPADAVPLSGQLTIRVLDERRTIPFTLAGRNARVASIQVRREARLVPAGF